MSRQRRTRSEGEPSELQVLPQRRTERYFDRDECRFDRHASDRSCRHVKVVGEGVEHVHAPLHVPMARHLSIRVVSPRSFSCASARGVLPQLLTPSRPRCTRVHRDRARLSVGRIPWY